MLLIADRPILIADVLHPAGKPFEADESYITRGVARRAAPPEILYEKTVTRQNAAALGEQGVTCLCVTRNRREWIPKAIESYRRQSYPARELLIVADGEDISDIVPEAEDIRLIHVEEGRNIGEKRNLGVQHARGKYIAHWDDDDRSAPDRLRDQIDRLRAAQLPVTGYSQIDFADGSSWWRYTGDNAFAPGSSLLYEKGWALKHPFRALQVNEDGEFVRVARERSAITTAPSNGMLTATIHTGNTSPRLTGERFWTPMERSASGLTVVIPSKTASNFQMCADAVRRHEPSARLILVDDGVHTNPGSPCADCERIGNIDFVAGETPFIFSRNVNAGIRAAGRDDVIVLNDDAILKTAGGFSTLQKAAQEHPELGIIATTTNNVGNRNQHPLGVGLREDPRMVCFVAVLIPRSTLDKIGYMDERFTAYGFEDDDYCYRVRRAGLKVGIHDGCFVDHGSLKSTFRGDPKTPANLSGGREIYIQKWGSYPL